MRRKHTRVERLKEAIEARYLEHSIRIKVATNPRYAKRLYLTRTQSRWFSETYRELCQDR